MTDLLTRLEAAKEGSRELDPYTIDRIAEMVISNALKWDDAEDIAAAIRALKGDG